MVKLENKLSSREVADMMEMGHSHLLRKIDLINEDFRKSQIGFSKYWTESSYKVDGNNKEYREFLITKRGCEFLAHKTTGTKGNLFTDRYMDKFAQMEKFIEEGPKKQLSPMEILELQFEIVREQGKKIEEVDSRIDKLENSSTIDYSQQEELRQLATKKVVAVLGGVDAPAYKELSKKAFSKFWNDYKSKLAVNTYRNTLVKDYELGRQAIINWEPSRELELMITGCNAQLRL